jgi:hypothetical protein
MTVCIPTIHEWQADPVDRTPTATAGREFPDPFNLQQDMTTPTLMSSDDEPDSYFDAQSPRSDRVRIISGGSQGLDDALNLPLPSSPAAASEYNDHDDNTIPFSRYIDNEKLRALTAPTS